MIKHGNRSVSSKSGSADVLEALGVHLPASPEQADGPQEASAEPPACPHNTEGCFALDPLAYLRGRDEFGNLCGCLACTVCRARDFVLGLP